MRKIGQRLHCKCGQAFQEFVLSPKTALQCHSPCRMQGLLFGEVTRRRPHGNAREEALEAHEVYGANDVVQNPYNFYVCETLARPSHPRMHATLHHSPDSSR